MRALTDDKVTILRALNATYPVNVQELDTCYRSYYRPSSPTSVRTDDLPDEHDERYQDTRELSDEDARREQERFTEHALKSIPHHEPVRTSATLSRDQLRDNEEKVVAAVERARTQHEGGMVARFVGTVAETVARLPYLATVVQSLIHALFCGVFCALHAVREGRGTVMASIAFVMGFVGAIVTHYFHIVPFFIKHVRGILVYFESWPLMGTLVAILRIFLDYVDFLAKNGCFFQLLASLGKLATGAKMWSAYRCG